MESLRKVGLFLCIALAFAPKATSSDHGVGNAGNPFDLMFMLGCERAAEMVMRFNPDDPTDASDDLKAFLLANKRELQREILRCDLRFTDDPKPIDHPDARASCALTNVSAEEYPAGAGDENTIYLSRSTCVAQGITEDLAAQTLIHEAVHHFKNRALSDRDDERITDEEFCNGIADVIYEQWLWRRSQEPRKWRPEPTLIDAPERRVQHTAVWTGATGNVASANRMAVWGGCAPSEDSLVECGQYFGDGGLFDPKTNKWQPIAATADSPEKRTLHTSVWTGDRDGKMIVWGGCNGADACFNSLASGGIYDVARDSWETLPVESATPSARVFHSAVWAKDRMIVWGGEIGYKNPDVPLTALKDGAVYIPSGFRAEDGSTKYWKKIREDGAPSARIQHTAVWTGKEMIVWGGCDMGGVEYQYCYELKGDGARYNPVTDTWAPMSSRDAPEARRFHSAVWTGNKMIVWGGQARQEFFKTGGIYDPETDTWHEMNFIAPTARARHVAVWTGTKMIVWGGAYLYRSQFQYPSDFGEYYPDPEHQGRDSWKVLSLGGHPDVAKDLTGVWAGDRMIIWGGNNYHDVYFDRGGSYFTVRD